MQKQALVPKDNIAINKQQYLASQKPLMEKRALSKDKQDWLDDELRTSALLGNTTEIRRLIIKGAGITSRSITFYNALDLAAQNGRIDACKLLIEKGADVNAKNDSKRTALMHAAAFGSTQNCALLLENGADLLAETTDGHTALMFAKANKENKTAAFLKSMEWLADETGSIFMSAFSDCVSAP